MDKKSSQINQNQELNFINKLLHPQMRLQINNLIKNGTIASPIIVEFDPTSYCNFLCPECINHDLLNSGKFCESSITNFLTEFKDGGVKGVIFIGGGEPLSHPSMPKPLVHAHDIGLDVGLTTNGSLIHRNLEQIANCVNWTRVSLDAAIEKTHKLFRPSKTKNAFSKIISSMEKLAKKKKGLLGYSFLIIERINNNEIETNIHELYDAAVLAKEIGCDYFEFKPMVDNDHNIIPLSVTSKDELINQIGRIKKLNNNDFRIIYPDSVYHLLSCENSTQQPKKYHSCPTLELRTVVTPSGIYPCPYKRGRINLGYIDKDFYKYWNNQDMRELRKKIDPSRDCPFFCIRNDMNVLLNTISEAYSAGINLLDYLWANEKNDDVFL